MDNNPLRIHDTSDDMNTNKRFVETSAGKIAYLESGGSGETIVFIHANSACKEFFSRQFDHLGQNYHIIAFDLPGHGKSENAKDPLATYSFPGYAAVMIEALKKLKVQKAVVCGWSLGGHIAMEMLHKDSSLIQGLFLTGSPPIDLSQEGFSQGFMPFEGARMMGQERKFTPQEAEEFFRMGGINPLANPYFIKAGVRTDGNARHFMIHAALNGQGINEKVFIQETDAPLAFVYGNLDTGINNEYIKSLTYKNLFGIFPLDAGHAVFWDKSTEFNTLLSDFTLFVEKNQISK